METFTTKLMLSFLSLCVVQISGELYECYGSDCPTFRYKILSKPEMLGLFYILFSSLPETTTEQDDFGVVKCNGTEFIVKDPKDCHQFYYCKPNDKESNTTAATHFKCPQGYGFQEEWQYCVPENLVKNCSAVYCPPFIYDGVIPDPQDCSAYYRCLYGFPSRYKCQKVNIFDAEAGQCKPYKEKPDCLKSKL
jgi:hypothetical protein